MLTKNTIINEDIDAVIQKNTIPFWKEETISVLITGANGLLPSYIVYYFIWLKQKGYKIDLYVIIRNNTHRLDILPSGSYTILWHDIQSSLRKDIKFHYIVHAASDATPKKYLSEKIQTINTNVLWLYNLFELDLSELKSFLYFSTAELYWTPDAENIPTKEDYIAVFDHLSERGCYVETKKFCETLCKNMFYEKNIPLKIVRPFHTFWPWVDFNDGRIFSDIIKNLFLKEDIIIQSDGKATRSFCYLADALDMFIKVLFSEHHGEVFNIGNPKNEISIGKLAEKMCWLVNHEINFSILGKANTTAPLRSCPDISKWISLLNFNPKYDVESSFARTLESINS